MMQLNLFTQFCPGILYLEYPIMNIDCPPFIVKYASYYKTGLHVPDQPRCL